MNYPETLDWLMSQLPMFQRQGAVAFRKDLDKVNALIDHLGHPEKKFKSIHIAGTNGKGSVAHGLASVLVEEGYKTGLYTSPHLHDFRERARINGKMVPEEFVVDFVERNRDIFESIQPSFFEMTVALAFQYFAQEEVDFAVIEVGMGGRLDATNIIDPEVSVITQIGLDHQTFLGDTLAEIAGEKAGIIKKDRPVVIGAYHAETYPVFEALAKELKSPIYRAFQSEYPWMPSDLTGDFQKENQATLLTTIDVLNELGYMVSDKAIATGLTKIRKNTGFRGRWEKVESKPDLILDTCHNPDGVKVAIAEIKKGRYHKIHWVFGMVSDKNPHPVLCLLPKDAQYYICKPDVPRGMDLNELSGNFSLFQLPHQAYDSVAKALEAAKKAANPEDLILVGGSIFLLEDIIPLYPL